MLTIQMPALPNAGGGRTMIETRRHQGWEVMLGGKVITTVFYDLSCDADYVKRSLIDHDGYNSGITVRKQK